MVGYLDLVTPYSKYILDHDCSSKHRQALLVFSFSRLLARQPRWVMSATVWVKGTRQFEHPILMILSSTGLNDAHQLKLVQAFKHSRNQVPMYVVLPPEQTSRHPRSGLCTLSRVAMSPRYSRTPNFATQDLDTREEPRWHSQH
jgi:hypothetical protein